MRGLDLPKELESRSQWICWRNECRECGKVLDPSVKVHTECDEKTTKRPINPKTGSLAKTDDPDTWGDLKEAQEFHEGADTHGIGFVFSEDDQFVGVDLDDCRDPETGEIEYWALDIVETLGGVVEISPSGTGLHIYVFGELDPEKGNRRDGVEMYDHKRYFTVTGDTIPRSHSSIPYRQEEIEAVQSGHISKGGSGGTVTAEELEDIDIPPREDVEDKEFTNDLGMSLEEVRDREPRLDACLREMEPDYTELEGNYENPDGQSTSEYDFSAAGLLWFWRFDRQQIVDIFHKYRYREKVKRPSTYLGAATGEQYDPRAHIDDDIEILDNRTQYDSIGDVDWPDGHFVLDKPPREGGSHASIDRLSNRPLVVLASRHTICEHHLEILDKVMPEGHTAVHYEGNNRACDHGGGESCPKYISGEDYTKLFDLEHEAKEVVHKQRIVTAEDSPERFCKAQFIKHAEKYAESVVTVPNLLESLETDPAGKNLLIDEEQALGYFRTPSVDIATIGTVYDPDGTRRVQAPSSPITTELDTLEEIRESIRDDQQARSEDGKTDRFIETDVEKDILNAIDYLEKVADTIAIDDLSEEMDNPDAGEMASEIRDRLSEIPSPEPNLTPANFREKIKEYVELYYFKDSVSPGSMIEAALFGYEDRKFDFKFASDGYKLRMIGGRDVFHADILAEFERIGVIAGPEGELLMNDLGLGDRTEVIDITDFEYADDFVIVPLGKEQDEVMEPVSTQRTRARRVSKILNQRAHPHLAVTGTKARAKSHHSSLVGGIADIISSPETPALDIDAAWTTGGTAVIYENSAVSRGIDAPQIDISVVASSGFATPYWEARAAHYEGEDEEEYQWAKNIERQLKSHELTNAVLRPSPTRFVDDITGTKFIVCSYWDAPRIKYVEQETTTFKTAETAANFIEQLTVEGGIRRQQEMVHNQVETEREYIETTMREEFKERIDKRPSYEIDELEKWIENRYFANRETVERIEMAVPPNAPVETSYVKGLFPDWAEGRVLRALDVLERKGIVESKTKDDGSRGKPTKLWSKDGF